MLQIEDLHAKYGNIEALHGVSLNVREGETVALIGANGAGKTTLLKAISGLLRPSAGTVKFCGARIDRLPAERIVQRGMAHVPEGRRIFPRHTVDVNLEMGAYVRSDRAQIREDIEKLLNDQFPPLKARRSRPAGLLSGGEQQMLAICRALLSRPTFLLMDEPSMGLAPLLVNEIFRIIETLRKEGKTILLVEQNAKKALKASNRAYVLESGRIVLEGPSSELLHDERVRKAYLGEQ
jgi:branched-chain amino acid transport system ATP-binding protein